MEKILYVTLDTEMDADVNWVKKDPKEYSSITVGIPNYLRPIWDELNVNPIYFVSPEVVDDEVCCKVLKEEIKRGAIIGAHLHPEFIEPQKDWRGKGPTLQFPCYSHNTNIEKEKINNLKGLIEERLDVSPEWYRAGRFGADKDTLMTLAELGFKYDSSITPGINWKKCGGPDFSSFSTEPSYIGEGIIKEIPVTILGKRCGIIGKIMPDNWLFYRWIRPSHMTLMEEKHLIAELNEKKVNEIVMMFHSMEVMINKTPFVRNNMMQKIFLKRLRDTIRYAQSLEYKTDI